MSYLDTSVLLARLLARALEPFPRAVRTLDALHLASAHFLRERDPSVEIATDDSSLAAAAKAMGMKTVKTAHWTVPPVARSRRISPISSPAGPCRLPRRNPVAP